jgi:hypothetical protein
LEGVRPQGAVSMTDANNPDYTTEIRKQNGGFVVYEGGKDISRVFATLVEAEGKFPKRIKLGARRYGYNESEIDAWLEQRAALRNARRDGGAV